MSSPSSWSFATMWPPDMTTAARGTDQLRREILTPGPAEALAGLLDITVPDHRWLPPLWHWVYLLDLAPHRELGRDGHALTGTPAPPGPGRRRMFAGGRVIMHRPLAVGAPATKQVHVTRTVEKQGRSGPLTFVTVRQEISQDDDVAIEEEQDIVYRMPGSVLRAGGTTETAEASDPKLVLDVDRVLMFRFSALTYNAHRIHYDRDYVQEEGYEDLVVHGPLQALMMAEFYRRRGQNFVGREFSYRLSAPAVGPQRLSAFARGEGPDSGVQVVDEGGRVTARARLANIAGEDLALR